MIELEQSILGQFIIYPETHIYIMRLNPNWFTEYRKELVSQLQTMYMHNEPITLGSIAKNFRKNLSEIATLQNIVTTNIYIEKEINQLEHHYKLEEIKRKMHDFDYNRTLQDIVNDLSLIISESTISLFTKPYNMSVVAGSVIDELYEATKRDNQITGIPTGWRYLDKYLGGWNQGNMVIVAGRPGCFDGNQLIHTKRGAVPIKDITTKDWVLSYNVEKDYNEWKPVIATPLHPTTEDRMFKISMKDGTIIKVTENHEFFTGSKFVKIKEILLPLLNGKDLENNTRI